MWNSSNWLRGPFGGGAEDRGMPPPPPPPDEDRCAAAASTDRGNSPSDALTSPIARAQMENDAAIAQSIAQAEQEEQDRRVAQQLAHQEADPRMPGRGGGLGAQRTMQMRCGTCQSAVSVLVPAASPPGTVIRASCNRCSMMNEFTIPSGGMAFPGPSSRAPSGPPVRQPSPPGPSMVGPSGPSAADFENNDLVHVACEIGGIAVEMMVDTGAQSSVCSRPLAQRLNLMSRLDQSRIGTVHGVGGNAQIVGRLRRMPVRLGQVEFELDFTVITVDEEMLILGIDQLRRFKVIVDLENQRLIFGGSDGVPVPFLPPSERRWTYRATGCPQM